MAKRSNSLHTETRRDLEAIFRTCNYLDQLSMRFRSKEDGRASLANYYWVGERLAPLLPRLTTHVLRSRRLKLEAHKLQPNLKMTDGPRGPLP